MFSDYFQTLLLIQYTLKEITFNHAGKNKT